MSYINFKEERAAAKEQLKKRKENNHEISKNMIQNKECSNEFNADNQYSYKTICNELLGKKGIENENEFLEIKNKDIVCCRFIQCKFNNVKFKDCKFIGCIFDKCEFGGGGVSFENCSFLKEDSSIKPSLNKKDNFSCYFTKCNLYVKILGCNAGFIIFEESVFNTSSFEQSDMSSIIIIHSELNRTTIIDSNLSGIKVLNTYIEDLEFRDKQKSKLDEKSFFDKLVIRKKTRDEYEGIYTIYENLADKFKENNLNNNFGEYYYICKTVQSKTLKLLPRIESYLYWFTCGYGERPWYALISSLVFVMLFGIAYLFTGLNVEGELVKYTLGTFKSIPFGNFIKDLGDGINLSVGVFGGVGWSSSEPTSMSYILENVEVVVGVVMMGIGIGTLVRKVVR